MSLRTLACVGIAALILGGMPATGAVPQMFDLPAPDNPNYSSFIPMGLSADGGTVVGWSQSTGGIEAYKWRSPALWTQAGGTQVFGQMDMYVTQAMDASYGAGLIGGISYSCPASWQGNSQVGVDAFGQGGVMAVSGDGNWTVGFSGMNMDPWFPNTVGAEQYGEAFRATKSGSAVRMIDNQYGTEEQQAYCAYGISYDGSVVAGIGNGYLPSGGTTLYKQAFRWTEATGTVFLGIAGPGSSSGAVGVSADGGTIVGYSSGHPMRWTESGGMELLLTASGETVNGKAYAASADGSVIVGTANSNAFIWDQTHGVRDLATVLTDMGLDLGGATFANAYAMSDDGYAILVSGNRLIVIPEPAGLSLVLLGGLLLRRRR